MTTFAKEKFESHSVASNFISSDIVNLSTGRLCAQERANLVQSILSNPETASLAKLGLRIASPSHQTASAFVSVANAPNTSFLSLRKIFALSNKSASKLMAGACASLALVAIFSFSNFQVNTNEPALVAMNQVQSGDHFGTAGSFEGMVSSNRGQSVDRFGSGGFEAE